MKRFNPQIIKKYRQQIREQLYNQYCAILKMSEIQRSDKKQQLERAQIPICTCGSMVIIFIVFTGSMVVLFSNTYVESFNDGQKVFDEFQIYRLFTSMFSIMNFIELGIMIACFIWIPFLLSDFEKKYGSIYTIYHFIRTHILISLLVDGIFEILFIITTMKNFIQVSAGIFPYCLYMYLKLALTNPGEDVDYWFLPLKMKRWLIGIFSGIFFMLLTPQSQGCLVVLVMYIFNLIGISLMRCFGCRKKVTSKSGPFCQYPFKILQMLIPKCIRRQPNFFRIKGQDEYDDVEEMKEMKHEAQHVMDQKL